MQITEPTLLLNERIVRRNIKSMAQKAAAHDLEFRPHFKTHQSHKIGGWFRENGIDNITVSSVKMAEYFADDGWNNITIAFPYNPRSVDRINSLARDITLTVLLSDENILEHLEQNIEADINVLIEIDTGSDRTGFLPSQKDTIEHLAEKISLTEHLHFSGLYSHPGHSYSCRSESEIKSVHRDVTEKVQNLKKHLSSSFPGIITCIGDTPCCSVADQFEEIDGISPGNFVFYDLMQLQIGACKLKDIGAALACPVVAKYPNRNEIIIHGGAVHLSKDHLDVPEIQFGKIVPIANDLTWSKPLHNCYVKSLSQEHGILKCNDSLMRNISLGDIIGILPIHSCLTANLMKSYTLTQSGESADHLEG